MASKKTKPADVAKKTTRTKLTKSGKGHETDRQDTTAAQPVAPVTTAPAPTTPKRLSALDAATKVLGETGQTMTTKELIGVMAARGYWTSPKGQTPHATLYAAILREIQAKTAANRFVKAGRGTFALRPTA